jgi:hypothetical protein
MKHARTIGLAYSVYISVLGLLYANLPPSPDQSIFDYIGWVWIEGGVPYADAADVNFPGAMALHALALLVFGNHLWSYRLFDYLSLLGFVAIVGATLSRRQGRAVALVFVPLYLTMYVVSGYWFAGQRDILAAHLVLVSGLLFLRRLEGGSSAWCVASGALIWAALLIKPTYLAYQPILLAIDVALRRRSGRGWGRILADQAIVSLMVGGLAGITLACGWMAGALDDWYDVSILFVSQLYAHDAGVDAAVRGLFRLMGHSWHWYTAYALIGGILWWRNGDRPALLVVLGVLAVTLVSAASQRKGFDYHFGGVLPVLGILIANLLARLAACCAAARHRPVARLAASLVILIAAVGLVSKLRGAYARQVEWHLGRISDCEFMDDYALCAPLQLAEFIRSHTDPGTTILTLGLQDDMIIHVAAERRNALRFSRTYLVCLARPPFRNATRWHEELESALRDRPPKYIIRSGGEFTGTRPQAAVNHHLDNYYFKVGTWGEGPGRYECFERRAGADMPGADGPDPRRERLPVSSTGDD